MKYLVMVQGTQADYETQAGKPTAGLPVWSDKDMQVMFEHMGAINNDLAESGELIDAQGLAEPARTRLVSAGADGRPLITDGPYGETKEVIAGYWLLECESLERVTEIAARVTRCPLPEGANTYPVVIRPLGEM
ncbi:YciI family protein [Streptomyces sp. CA-111067]|uniref:YciI family protein n=1 Tax=Streptomyces sp. CA-111067 TaxID=3240046 RepID=UPI003D95F2B5